MDLKKINYKNKKLNVEINCYIDEENEIWFRGKEIALMLGNDSNTKRVIRKRVDVNDKKMIDFEIQISGKDYKTTQKCFFINESGLYSLIYSSKGFNVKELRRWITKKVLPSIKERKHKNVNDSTIKIETENDLHYKVVDFIREKFPEALMIAGLGENQKTDIVRLDSWKKGYMAGQCDLMLMNPTNECNSLCLEFKSPTGKYQISEKQLEMKEMYENNKCKYLMSSSYDDVIFEVVKHMQESETYLKRYRHDISVNGKSKC